MDDVYKYLLLYASIPTIVGIGSFLMKSVHSRLTEIEKEVLERPSESDVRTLISDRVDPIREDIQELKIKLDKIIDVLISK